MQQEQAFQIAHVEPHDRRRIAFAHAVLMNSRRLLLQPTPNLFLGEQHNVLPLPDETEQRRAAEAQKYHRLAVECRELAVILDDQREAYLKMARTYDAMANGK